MSNKAHISLDGIAPIIAEALSEHLRIVQEESRGECERRRKFGEHGEKACAALRDIADTIRHWREHGGMPDADGVAEAVLECINKQFPDFEDVWQ